MSELPSKFCPPECGFAKDIRNGVEMPNHVHNGCWHLQDKEVTPYEVVVYRYSPNHPNDLETLTVEGTNDDLLYTTGDWGEKAMIHKDSPSIVIRP